MGSLVAVFAGFTAVAVVIGFILGRIENFRLSVGAGVAAIAIGITLFVKSSDRRGDGFGEAAEFAFGVLWIWAALVLMIVSFAVQASRENARKEKQNGDGTDDDRP
jgi:succinate-acetate transporter protein